MTASEVQILAAQARIEADNPAFKVVIPKGDLPSGSATLAFDFYSLRRLTRAVLDRLTSRCKCNFSVCSVGEGGPVERLAPLSSCESNHMTGRYVCIGRKPTSGHSKSSHSKGGHHHRSGRSGDSRKRAKR